MSAAIELARAYGVRVRFADLGDWGTCSLYSEYDARRGEIRLNVRIVEQLDPCERRRFVALAVGHELYHHREACGETSVIADRSAREAAADAFARELFETPS